MKKKTMNISFASMDRREFLWGAGVVGGSLLLNSALPGATAYAAEAKFQPKYHSSFSKEQEYYYLNMTYELAERIKEKTNGEVVPRIYPSGQLGGQRAVAEKVQLGTVELCVISTANLSPFIPEYNLLDLPYLFPTWESSHQILMSPVMDETIHQNAMKKGFKILTYNPDGFRMLVYNGEETVKHPDQMKDLKVRVTGSAIEQRAFKIFGANPTPVEWAETYSALQQGVVDAVHNSFAVTYVSNLYEPVNRISEINFMLNNAVVFASMKWWEKLPKELQQAFDEVSREAFEWHGKTVPQRIAEAAEIVKKSGVDIYTPTHEELGVWKEKGGHQLAVWDDIKERYGQDTYEKIAAAVEKL